MVRALIPRQVLRFGVSVAVGILRHYSCEQMDDCAPAESLAFRTVARLKIIPCAPSTRVDSIKKDTEVKNF